jgi:hypothetical protein
MKLHVRVLLAVVLAAAVGLAGSSSALKSDWRRIFAFEQ